MAVLSVAYGGGGLFGIAYTAGIAEALIDAGVPLRDAPALGTSAGAWTGAAIRLDVTWASAIEMIGELIPRWPNLRPGKLRSLGAALFGEAHAPGVRVVVCELPRLRRVILDAAQVPVADLVAASSAVPGVLAPHRIGGRLYVDGGVRSLVSADCAADAQNLLVVAPLAGPMFGPAGRLIERRLRREIDGWSTLHPTGKTWLIRPNHDIADLARRPDQLFDPARARACYELARQQGAEVARHWRADQLPDYP